MNGPLQMWQVSNKISFKWYRSKLSVLWTVWHVLNQVLFKVQEKSLAFIVIKFWFQKLQYFFQKMLRQLNWYILCIYDSTHIFSIGKVRFYVVFVCLTIISSSSKSWGDCINFKKEKVLIVHCTTFRYVTFVIPTLRHKRTSFCKTLYLTMKENNVLIES